MQQLEHGNRSSTTAITWLVWFYRNELVNDSRPQLQSHIWQSFVAVILAVILAVIVTATAIWLVTQSWPISGRILPSTRQLWWQLWWQLLWQSLWQSLCLIGHFGSLSHGHGCIEEVETLILVRRSLSAKRNQLLASQTQKLTRMTDVGSFCWSFGSFGWSFWVTGSWQQRGALGDRFWPKEISF